MTEVRYKLYAAAKRAHMSEKEVRFFEQNLSLSKRKTEQGSVYYTQEDVARLRSIKVLYNKGFHIKAIQSVLPYIDRVIAMEESRQQEFKLKLEEALGLQKKDKNKDKNDKPFESSMNQEKRENIQSQAEHNSNLELKTEQPNLKGKEIQIRQVMGGIISDALKSNNEYLVKQINQTLLPELDYRMRLIEQKEEEHYRQLDRAIRDKQLVMQQTAITKDFGSRKKSKFFKKNNIRI